MTTRTYRLTTRDLEARARALEREAREHEAHQRYPEAAECRQIASHYRVMRYEREGTNGSSGTEHP